MRRILRHRPSPALVVACLALTIALGGTSYAAVTLPRNSVGTPQLKRNAVNSLKVKNFSLLRVDFKRGQIPAGARGPQGLPRSDGATGATGATGPAGPFPATLPAGQTVRGWYWAGIQPRPLSIWRRAKFRSSILSRPRRRLISSTRAPRRPRAARAT